jgi:hypothetical protein
VRTIVGVLTREEMTDRREACASTWVGRLRKTPDVEVVFVVGNGTGEAWLDGGVLHLPCGDAYESLVNKTREFCRWALTQDIDYLFKCDDDTFVVVDRFQAFDPAGRDYIGVDPVDHINPKFASGGAGYWLSRRAAQAVAEMDVDQTIADCSINAEDYCVYWTLKDRFTFCNDLRFRAWNEPHCVPKSSNESVTLHYVKPDEMYRLDSYIDEIASTPGYDGGDRGSIARFDSQFALLQSDWMGSLGRNSGPIVLQESLSVIGEAAHQIARDSMQPAFTYLRALDGFENFKFLPLPYDLDYVPLVKSHDPLGRINKASYVFGRKQYGVDDGYLFGVAPYRCNYQTRYAIAQCVEQVDSSACGPSVLDKIRHQNRFKFAIACENLIADGYITEKLLDCFQADTIPIFSGGWLPAFLEHCVVRLTDVSSVEAIAQQLDVILAMPDEEYMEKLEQISLMRFAPELYDTFSYSSFFNAIGIDVDPTRIRGDGSTILD